MPPGGLRVSRSVSTMRRHLPNGRLRANGQPNDHLSQPLISQTFATLRHQGSTHGMSFASSSSIAPDSQPQGTDSAAMTYKS